MEREKLIAIAKVLAIALVIVLLVVFVVIPKLGDEGGLIGKKDEGISTDITFNASDYDSGKLVQDYSNPTDDEKHAINMEYGSTNNYFDEEGLHLVNMNDLIEGEEDKLITDKWPNHPFVEAIKKPDMDVTKIEVGETYLKISVSNVTKKDMEKYIKDIKKEYKKDG